MFRAVKKTGTSFRDIFRGQQQPVEVEKMVSNQVREFNMTELFEDDDPTVMSDQEYVDAMNRRMQATLAALADSERNEANRYEVREPGLVDGDDAPNFRREGDGSSLPMRTDMGRPGAGVGTYALEAEGEEPGDLSDEGSENWLASEGYRPRSAGFSAPEPSNRVAGEVRKRASGIFRSAIFGDERNERR